MDKLGLEVLPDEFTICKVEDFSKVDWQTPFVFAAGTDDERSLVCPSACVPANVLKKEPEWKGLRIQGPLDFSLTGILARLAQTLANARIAIFAVSTFDTDYLFIKKEQFGRAEETLKKSGYFFNDTPAF